MLKELWEKRSDEIIVYGLPVLAFSPLFIHIGAAVAGLVPLDPSHARCMEEYAETAPADVLENNCRYLSFQQTGEMAEDSDNKTARGFVASRGSFGIR